jgi:carboxylesterase type B
MKNYILSILVIAALCQLILAEKKQAEPTIGIPQLNVVFKGTTDNTVWTKKPFFMFYDIPYAKDPVDDLKYMPPVPVDEEFYDANSDQTYDSSACYTFTEYDYYPTENCLSLNIATQSKEGKRPVIVYLTGSNIVSGTSDNYYSSPNQLLEEDVVLVTVQFRVGFLGFLSTGTDDAPGNNGILDCIEALRWIKRYISHFGGDPDLITLIGNYHSAAIAHILTITPLITDEENLFTKVIYQSGSALMKGIATDDPLTITKEIATIAKCSVKSPTIIANCLKALEEDAMREAYRTYVKKHNKDIPLITIGGPSGVLPIEPQELIEATTRKAYPMLGGVVKHAGYHDFEDDKLERDLTAYRTGLEHVVDQIHNNTVMGTAIDQQKSILPKKIFLNNLLTSLVPTVVDMNSYDTKYSTSHVLKMNAEKHSPSFLYAFNYPGEQSSADSRFNGVFIDEEDKYLFTGSYPELNRNDKRISQLMVELWTSFATTGTPTAKELYQWPAVSGDMLGPYLKIDKIIKLGYKYETEYFATVKDEEKGIHIITTY